MTPHNADCDAAYDARHALKTRIHEALLDHDLSSGGRNLGQYRTAWTCACGYEFVTDGHRDVTLYYAWREHLANVAAMCVTTPVSGVTP